MKTAFAWSNNLIKIYDIFLQIVLQVNHQENFQQKSILRKSAMTDIAPKKRKIQKSG